MNQCQCLLLVSVPHRYGCLSGSHTITAGDEVRTRLQALRSEFQTHKAELNLTARTDDVLAASFVVLHPLTTGGAGPDGGTGIHPLNLRQGGSLAVLEKFEFVIDAAVIVTAIRAWSSTFPWLQTLPAELGHFLVVCCADCALNIEVSQVLSLHIGFATWTCFKFTVFCGSKAGHVLFKVLHLFCCQYCQPAHLCVGPHCITLLQGAIL